VDLIFNLHKSGGEGATGKAQAVEAVEALGGGRAHAAGAALAARRTWRSAHMDWNKGLGAWIKKWL
jgi:hypothetical protein